MFVISYPLTVRRAVLNEPNPIPGLTNRFSQGWSCSTISTPTPSAWVATAIAPANARKSDALSSPPLDI